MNEMSNRDYEVRTELKDLGRQIMKATRLNLSADA